MSRPPSTVRVVVPPLGRRRTLRLVPEASLLLAMARNRGTVDTAVKQITAELLAGGRNLRRLPLMHRPTISNRHEAGSPHPSTSPMALAQNIPSKTRQQDAPTACPGKPIKVKADPILPPPPPSHHRILTRNQLTGLVPQFQSRRSLAASTTADGLGWPCKTRMTVDFLSLFRRR